PDGTNQPAKLYVPLWRSTNDGESFLPPINALPGVVPTAVGDIADKPALIADNFPGDGQGNVYLAITWQKTNTTTLLVYRSASGGNSWTNSTEMIIAGTSAGGGSFAIAPNHDVYLAWPASPAGNPRFYLTKSTDLGTNFSAPTTPFLTNNASSID